jgi:hypothetical protein
VISGFRRQVAKNCARLDCGLGPMGCPETLVQNYHYSLRNNPKERSSEQKYIGEYVM